MSVISASRRTDIPAFYSEWFMNRIRAGYVCWRNARSGITYTVSLRPEDVGAIVFRSKNYLPLLPYLDELDGQGYGTVFHCTITGLPKVFEPNVPELPQLLECARFLSSRYGPDRLLWRCDPVLISSITGAEYYRNRFEELAAGMEGLTNRCYFCYPIYHKSVLRNTGGLHRSMGVECFDTPRSEQIEIATILADIAADHGIQMLSCCGDYLVGGKIGKAHCIDAELLHRLLPDRIGYLAEHPIREECGCAECTDIGAYDTCLHGCVYCYANTSREAALRNHRRHDPEWDMLDAKGFPQPSSKVDSWSSTLELPF
ncbi:MAG TPA: DUF1848 domain-containing protein [Armatimonadota bacterium]|nr:DUF1848 domain-containing protein [Armatimonadota bacterium]